MSKRSPRRKALLDAKRFAKRNDGYITQGPEGSVCRVVGKVQPDVCCVSCGIQYGSPVAELPMRYFSEGTCEVCKKSDLVTPPHFFGLLSPLWRVHKPGAPVAKLVEALSEQPGG